MKKLTKLLRWLDNNLLLGFLYGFVILIPLYPKLPLGHVEFTYVYIRADDLYVAAMTLVFLIQLIRKKVSLRLNFGKEIAVFWLAVFTSFIFGAFIQKSIAHPSIGFLNAARRVEYMVVFFIFLSVVRSRKVFFRFLYTIAAVFLIVVLYAIGQKTLGFPAVQTMNPEFARGHILYLTQEARVSSTFAGHYDLAAYIVFLIPLILSLGFVTKSFIYLFISFIGIFVLTLTASRTSFIAYIFSTIPYLVYLKKILLAIVIVIVSFTLMFFTKDLTKRFMRTVQIKQLFINEKTGQVIVPEKSTVKQVPIGTSYIKINSKKIAQEISKETNPVRQRQLVRDRIIDELRGEASKSGRVLTKKEEDEAVNKVIGDFVPIDTVVSDISSSTRFQVEWPRAIAAFKSNIFLGTGPSSITESTDGDYFRWLGETGLFGTLSFLYLLYKMMLFIFNQSKKKKFLEIRFLLLGLIFGTLGLLINAMYIDVFEASKVAYTFWAVMGIFIGYLI